jgi:O-antigen/teichoic acid export membrane protein
MTADAGADARSARRFRLARLAVAAAGIERAVVTAVSLVRVPLLIWGLDLDHYGLYMATLGIVATGGLLDVGLHFGVLNAVAEARGREDDASIRRIVATAFLIYVAIVLVAGCVLAPVLWALPMDRLLGTVPEQAALARQVALIGFAGLLLPMPLKVFSAGLQGFQMQHAVSLYRAASSLAQLGLLAAVVVAFRGRLLAVVGAGLASELLHWLVFAWYAVRRQPELALDLRAASRTLAPHLAMVGLAFFVTSVANLLKFALGSTIVSNELGPGAVPGFSVPMALFMAAFGLATMVGRSFWPAYAEAAARGEWPWVRRAFALGTRTAIGAAGAFAVPGWLFGGLLIDRWIPKEIAVSEALLALLGVWLVLQAAVSSAGTLLSGLQRVRMVMWIALAEGLGVLGGSLWLVQRIGVAGIGAAMALASLGSALALLGFATRLGTDGRVPAPWGALGRVGPCIAVAAAVGLLARSALRDADPLAALGLGAGLTVSVYSACAWLLVLDGDQRARSVAWVLRRARLLLARPR